MLHPITFIHRVHSVASDVRFRELLLIHAIPLEAEGVNVKHRRDHQQPNGDDIDLFRVHRSAGRSVRSRSFVAISGIFYARSR